MKGPAVVLAFGAVFFSTATVPVTAICNEDTNGTILQGPMDVIAFQNERITFICRIEASASIETAWDINGTHHPLLTSDATRQKWRYPNSTMNYTYGDYYFYLTARAEYNNSQILCRYTPFYSEWVFTCSDNATLTIQGPPEAVSDLSVSENGSHVEVIWVAPFSLDVTGVEYDITYSILISNVTDETSPMPVACAVCHNLTLTHFTFSPPHPLPGHSFTFTVTPQNGAGSGPPSQSLTATLTDDDDEVLVQSSTSEMFTIPTSTPTIAVPSEDYKVYFLAFWYGLIPAIVLLLLLTSLGVAVLICHLMRCRQQKKSRNDEIFVQPNPVYDIRGQTHIAVRKNIAYETVHIS